MKDMCVDPANLGAPSRGRNLLHRRMLSCVDGRSREGITGSAG